MAQAAVFDARCVKKAAMFQFETKFRCSHNTELPARHEFNFLVLANGNPISLYHCDMHLEHHAWRSRQKWGESVNKYFLGLMVLTLVAVNADASRNDRREQRQEARIQQGIQNGSLTPEEASKLQNGQARVDHMQQKAMADGKMSPQEKMRLEKMQDRQSHRIHRMKHGEKHAEPATH